MTTTTNSTPRARVADLFDQWQSGLISKYEFYEATMRHRPSLIAEVTGISPGVIVDRRQYLRILAMR